MAVIVQTAEMGRPKAEKPKQHVVSTRTFTEVRDAVSEYARREHRTIAQMADLLLREAIIARRKRDKEPATEIETLP